MYIVYWLWTYLRNCPSLRKLNLARNKLGEKLMDPFPTIIRGLAGSALDHRSLPPELEHNRGHIWRVFHLWLCFITFGGRTPHLTRQSGLLHQAIKNRPLIPIHNWSSSTPEDEVYCKVLYIHALNLTGDSLLTMYLIKNNCYCSQFPRDMIWYDMIW